MMVWPHCSWLRIRLCRFETNIGSHFDELKKTVTHQSDLTRPGHSCQNGGKQQVHGNAFCKNGTEKNSGKAGGIITTFARFLSYKVKGKRFLLAYSTLTKNGRSVHISIQVFICCGERHIAQTPRPPADGQSVRQQDNIKGAERYLVADSQPVVGCKAPWPAV